MVSENICSCRHFKSNHSVKSKFTKDEHWVRVFSCNESRCKCNNFQSTSFIPESGKFEIKEVSVKDKIVPENLEFGFVEDIKKNGVNHE